MIAREYVAEGTCTRRVLAIAGVSESTSPKQAHAAVGQHQRSRTPMVRSGQKNSSEP
ncbi:MAG: hypothetical protein UZ06_CHB003000956 [Chlorobi bacterium OLB6]|nr:MAG: hypothetical protein UZ06_CHB003000956 [Chlorobi bacterium OLB6]